MSATLPQVQQLVASAFAEGLPTSPTTEPQLAGALHHVLANPGSLVRATLAFQLSSAFGLPNQTATALATGLEYMHTASLLFDDMPSMDDAQERRSDFCVHVLFGEAACTLAALAFVNRGYALLWQAMSQKPDRQGEAVQQIEKCLGLEGMLTGQSRDLHHSSSWTARDVFMVSMGKTVALIRLTLVLPALLGHASPCQLHSLHQLGVYWGLSYQILDDLKDVCDVRESTGKTIQRDAALGRPNIALVEGAFHCIKRVSRLLRMSDAVIGDLIQSNSQIRFLAKTQQRLQSELSRFQPETLSACA